MGEGLLGIVLLVLLASIAAVIYHHFVNEYWRANIYAAATASIILHVIGYLWNGYLEPFFIISLVVATLLSLLIASIIGSLVHR